MFNNKCISAVFILVLVSHLHNNTHFLHLQMASLLITENLFKKNTKSVAVLEWLALIMSIFSHIQ